MTENHEILTWSTTCNPDFHGSIVTPWKINMEPTNHPFRKENDLSHTSMIMFHVNLPGCKSHPKKNKTGSRRSLSSKNGSHPKKIHQFFSIPPNKNSNNFGSWKRHQPQIAARIFLWEIPEIPWLKMWISYEANRFIFHVPMVSFHLPPEQPTNQTFGINFDPLQTKWGSISWIPGQPHPRFYFSFITLLSSRPLS